MRRAKENPPKQYLDQSEARDVAYTLHMYASVRPPTTDAFAPVAPYTVMKELGHGSLKLIEETCGYLMETGTGVGGGGQQRAGAVDTWDYFCHRALSPRIRMSMNRK